MSKRQTALALVCIVLLAVSTGLGVTFPLAQEADFTAQASQPMRVRSLQVDHTTNIDGDTTMAGTLALTGALTGSSTGTFATGLTVTAGGATITAGGLGVTAGGITITDGNLVVADIERLTPQTTLAVASGTPITPVGSYQPISSTAAAGVTITVGTAGDTVTFINITTPTITITDTGTTMLSGNAALGQYDTLTVYCDGTNWIEVAQTNN